MPANCCSRRARCWWRPAMRPTAVPSAQGLAEQLQADPRPAAGGGEPLRRRRHLPVRRPGLERAAVRRCAAAGRRGRSSAPAHAMSAAPAIRRPTRRPVCRWRSTGRRSGPRRAPATASSRSGRSRQRRAPGSTAAASSIRRALTGARYSVVFDAATTSFDITNLDSGAVARRRAVRCRAVDRARRHGLHGQRHAHRWRDAADRAVGATAERLRRARQGGRRPVRRAQRCRR